MVFLDYDQAALDAAYNQAAYAPNREQLLKRQAANSAAARARIGPPERVAYGNAAIERLDIYRSRREGVPVVVFIHGGAWRAGLARDFATPAEMFLAAGAHYVVPDFSWVQDAGGSLMVLADQVRRAIAWVYRNAAGFGGDPNRLYVVGQSSGGHLAAVALTTDWPRQFGLPAELIKAGMCISGIYDLAPVRLSARRQYVAFDDATVAALSPLRHIDKLRAPLVVAYGTLETPEFQRQNREFAEAVVAAGKPVRLLVGEHYNHFELPETLANPYGLLGRAALELMRLSLGGAAGCEAEEPVLTILDLKAAFARLRVLRGRTPETPAAEREGAFARLAPYRDGGVFAARFQGESAWERHPQGEEIVQIVDGATTLHVITEEGTQSFALKAGMMAIVPQGAWHRFEAPDGVSLMTATPQPTEHLTVAVDDPRTLE